MINSGKVGSVLKILIVEDEQLLADSLGELLQSKGFEVEIVYDGESGAQYAELGVYDLLVLDVMMPKMNGYEVRAHHLGTPILMLTARSGLEDRITGLNAGADYYLTKPFDTREFLACINALLRRQGTQVDELSFGNTVLDLDSATLICGNNRTFPRKPFWPAYGGMILTRWKIMWRSTSVFCAGSSPVLVPTSALKPSGVWATIWKRRTLKGIA